MTRCPSCGAHVRSITRETGGRWSLSCGDWTTADNANVGPNGRVLERRAITRALRHRAARHRGDTND